MKSTILAEIIRLTSTRLWVWAAFTAVACGGGFTAILVSVADAPSIDTRDGVNLVVGILSVTLFLPAVFGTVAMTGEYRHRTITTTFLFSPVRWRVLVAKLIVYATAGLAYGLILAGSATAAILIGAGIHGTTVGAPPLDLAGLMLRLAAACAIYTLIGVGMGGLVVNQIAALAIIVGYFYFLELVLMLIPGVQQAYPYLPGGASASLLGFTYLTDTLSAQTGAPIHLLPPVVGGVVLLSYAAVAAVLTTLVPLRRDLR